MHGVCAQGASTVNSRGQSMPIDPTVDPPVELHSALLQCCTHCNALWSTMCHRTWLCKGGINKPFMGRSNSLLICPVNQLMNHLLNCLVRNSMRRPLNSNMDCNIYCKGLCNGCGNVYWICTMLSTRSGNGYGNRLQKTM